jgi:hypothetical protein
MAGFGREGETCQQRRSFMAPHRLIACVFFLTGLLALGLAVVVLPKFSVGQEAPKRNAHPRETVAGEPAAALRQDLRSVQLKLGRLEVKIRLQKDVEKSISELQAPEALIDRMIDEDPFVQEQVSLIRHLQEQLAEDAKYWRDGKNHPQFQDRRSQIESLQKVLKDYRAEHRPMALEELRDEIRHDWEKGIMGPLREKIALLRQEEKDLKNEIMHAEQTAISSKTSGNSTAQRLGRLEEEVRKLRTAIEELKKTEELKCKE